MTQRGPRDERSDPGLPNPLDLFAGRAGLQLMVLAVAGLAIGGVIAIAARGSQLDGPTIGMGLAGLLLLAPVAMLAGDLTDAGLLWLVGRRRLAVDAYQRTSTFATPTVVLVVGIAIYPVVLALGGPTLLGVVVIAGAFVVFGALPIAAWLMRRLRGPRAPS